MKLEEMSGEELVSYRDDCREFMGPDEASKSCFVEASKELITRLTRGDKAIKAMEKIDKIYINHRAYDEYVDSVRSIIQQYRREK